MHVTVLMAAYNEGERVRRAVESVQSQTYTDWDLIVVDDASTDCTVDILQEFAAKDQRISIVRNAANRGLAASLNLGWRMAEGELIARMDADDVCLPHRLQQQVAFLTQHPEVAVLGGGAELTNAKGVTLGSALRRETHAEMASRILYENPFIHPSVMLRRRFLDALGGYDERLRRAQDYDLWARGLREFHYHNLREPLVRYQVRDRPTWGTILWGTYVTALVASRETGFLAKYWFSLRFLASTTLSKMGLRRLAMSRPS